MDITLRHHVRFPQLHQLNDGELMAMLEGIAASIHTLKEMLMKTQAELTADLTAVSAQLTKIGVETSTTLQRVADLEAALASSGATSPELEAAVEALKVQIQVVDDLVADAPAP